MNMPSVKTGANTSKKESAKRSAKTVVVSGGFDPVHIGHLEMFRDAKRHGEKLIVVLNNDNWLLAKKGFVFLPQEQRKEIIAEFRCVDEVILTSHVKGTKDMSVCTELRAIKPDIFANGGDRKADNIPEYQVCEELGIAMVFNIGGGKAASSSDLAKEVAAKIGAPKTTKPWGFELLLRKEPEYVVKILHVEPGRRLSKQYHEKKWERMIVARGHPAFEIGEQKFVAKPHEQFEIVPGTVHRFGAVADVVEIVEVSTPELDDVVRLEDDYGRKGT